MGGAFRSRKKRAREEQPSSDFVPLSALAPPRLLSRAPTPGATAQPRVGPQHSAGPTGRREIQHGAPGASGGRRGPRPKRALLPGFSRAAVRRLLTFSSTQLTMMDGYLRLSQRKKAGTPIAAAQLEEAARPADERNQRDKQERRPRAPTLPPTCAPATGSDVTTAPPRTSTGRRSGVEFSCRRSSEG